jgi:uncharacterized membrane protein YhaH (DUF805 family)
MLPFDNRPWAKALARTVIVLSVIAAALGVYYCQATDQLHISEVAIIGLLLLTILPPNIAIVVRKTEAGDEPGAMSHPQLHTR